MSRNALKIFSPLLRTYLSKEGGSFGVHGFRFGMCVYGGVLRGVGETRSPALQCPVAEGTHGGRWRDRLLMMLEN